MRTTTIRFSGLASGLDTESIVSNMLTPYQLKVDTAQQNKTLMEWRKDAWKEMNSKLFNFYDKYVSNARLESAYSKRTIGVSNSNAITVGTNSTLPEGTHTIDEIKKLAQGVKVETDNLSVAGGGKVTSTTKLSELMTSKNGTTSPILESGSIRIQVSDSKDAKGNPIYKEVEISAEMTVGQLQKNLNDALPNTNVSFDAGAGAFFISGKKTGESQFLSITSENAADATIAFTLLGIKNPPASKEEMVTGEIKFETTVKAPTTTKLSDLGLTLAEGDKAKVSIGDKSVSIDLKESMTLADLEKAINTAIGKEEGLKGEVSCKYDGTTGKLTFLDKDGKPLDNVSLQVVDKDDVQKDDLTAKLQPVDGFSVQQSKKATADTTLHELGIIDSEFSITIGETTFTHEITDKTTLKELTESIQAQIDKDDKLKGNTFFSFDEKNNRLSISTKHEVSGDKETLKKLGVSQNQKVQTFKGENAELTYNGVKVESESNNISVNGFNFMITATTTEAITVTSVMDTEAIVDYVKEFITEYNNLITDIQSKLDADSTKGYSPLTDAQKKEMSEYEIEQWESKIKGGLFRKDPDLEKLLNDMRGIFSDTVEGGSFSALSQIGITTGSWSDKGKLFIDEDKLRAAVNSNAQGVIDLFAKNGETTKQTGYADRLYDMITTQTKSSSTRTAYSFYNDKVLSKNITSKSEEIEKLQERLYNMEDMYYARFTAMEKMMQQLNNQSSYLTSMMGGA